MSNELAVLGPPSPSEWSAIESQVAQLAKSNIVPAAFRGKPAEIIAAVLTGRELGLGPMAALRSIHVIEGKAGLSAEAMLALVRRAGHSVTGETSPTVARVTGKRGDNGDVVHVEFTLEQAKAANLTGKGVWKSYAPSMLWARAVSQLCRQLFSDVLLGMAYTAEELGDDPESAEEEITEAELVEEVPEGWDSLEQCMASHDFLAARLRDLPEDDPIRAKAKELRVEHGWPWPQEMLDRVALEVSACRVDDMAEADMEWDTTTPDGEPL